MSRKKKIILAAAGLFLIWFLGEIWISYNSLTVRRYEWELDASKPGESGQEVKLVVLSDLHDHEFGEKNGRLKEKVEKLSPDLILLVGDFLNEDSENAEIPCELVEGLCEIAPVFYSMGNHEESYRENGHENLTEQLEQAGAAVLERTYRDVDLNGGDVRVRIGGMYEYAFGLDGRDEAGTAPEKVGRFLEEFEATDRLKIMMAHRPDSFIFGDAALHWDIDLVVSGHDHGGQVVLPVLGGLYGGDQGWFPEYVHGMYKKDRIRLFVTSGLGSNKKLLPRFHNPPEIALVTVRFPETLTE